MAAERLTALNISIPGPVDSMATERRARAVCLLISACLNISHNGGMLDQLPPFLPFSEVLLHCGAAAQQFMAQQLLYGRVTPKQLGLTLAAQVWPMDTWQHLACCLADAALDMTANGDGAALMQACAPLALLQTWLQRTLASLRLLAPPSWKPGGLAGKRGLQRLLIQGVTS